MGLSVFGQSSIRMIAPPDHSGPSPAGNKILQTVPRVAKCLAADVQPFQMALDSDRACQPMPRSEVQRAGTDH